MAYDKNRAPVSGDGVAVTNEMATPLQSGMHRYWDAHWKNIVLQFLSSSHPNVRVECSNDGDEFTAVFRVDDRSGRELCETSSSLVDSKTTILERELDELVACLDRLHKEAEKKSTPEGLRRFVREYRIPDPLQMPNAWRVSRGSKRRLFVLWGYHDKGAANSVVRPLTPTSKGWADVERRVDLKERLREAGRIRKSRFDWGWMSFYVLLAMAVSISLGYGALQKFCPEEEPKEHVPVVSAVEPMEKPKVKPVPDAEVQHATDEQQPVLVEAVTNLEVVDEKEIDPVEETLHTAQGLNTELAVTDVASPPPVMEICQPMPESDSELGGKDVLVAEAETEAEAAIVKSHLEPIPKTNAVLENVEVPVPAIRDKTLFERLADEVLNNMARDADTVR